VRNVFGNLGFLSLVFSPVWFIYLGPGTPAGILFAVSLLCAIYGATAKRSKKQRRQNRYAVISVASLLWSPIVFLGFKFLAWFFGGSINMMAPTRESSPSDLSRSLSLIGDVAGVGLLVLGVAMGVAAVGAARREKSNEVSTEDLL
jgi:hypothetical protein